MQTEMKAVIAPQYGSPDVLEVTELKRPEPQKNQVLIQNFASSINAYDWHKLRGDSFMIKIGGGGFFKPKNAVLGCDIAGKVVAVGQDVTRFKAGDDVYGCMADGLGEGGYAEYVVAPEKTLALKPAQMSFEQAAAIPMAGLTAFQSIELANIQEGQSVLITGASGGVGSFAVQFARNLGANVTAVCGGKNAGMVMGIGAASIIDYRKENFWENGKLFDTIIDIAPNCSLKNCIKPLSKNGSYILVGFKKTGMIRHMFATMFSKNGKMLMAQNTKCSDLEIINAMFESARLQPIIDSVYPLDNLANAMRHYENQGAKGKIVIKVQE